MKAPRTDLANDGPRAVLRSGGHEHTFAGTWIEGSPWQRFGRYDTYVMLRADGRVGRIPAHAGELVPGSTEDLVEYILSNSDRLDCPASPLTLELDPTYSCASKDCGGRCFSAAYRVSAPTASIPSALCTDVIRAFAGAGGRIVRFDGGGDPLCHPDVQNGRLPLLAAELGLKSTVLTSGDLLPRTHLQALVDARCYVRISLNAATQASREAFHGNKVQLSKVCQAVEELAARIGRDRADLPIGCSFLLDTSNMAQLLPAAILAKSLGAAHFSVRRVLGPPSLRPPFTPSHQARLSELFLSVKDLECETFQVFLPWRAPEESDLNPARGDLHASRCWQSTLKTVVEPDPSTGGMQAQLCGRYRGGVSAK